MSNQGNIKKTLLIVSIVLSIFLNRQGQTYAYGALVAGNNVRPDGSGGYVQVMVSGSRYYYHQGSFYSGSPGNYVVVQAPAGAIVNDVPAGYESVVVGGNNYLRYHNVYYRHHPQGGYEVVQNKDFHEQDNEPSRTINP